MTLRSAGCCDDLLKVTKFSRGGASSLQEAMSFIAAASGSWGSIWYLVYVQMGYNFLYGLWKYSWDSDCDLFLKILEGEIKEDVYTQQIALQAQIIPWKLSLSPSVTE